MEILFKIVIPSKARDLHFAYVKNCRFPFDSPSFLGVAQGRLSRQSRALGMTILI